MKKVEDIMIKKINFIGISFLLVLIFISLSACPISAQGNDGPVHLVELEGTISTGQKNFLQRQVQKALDAEAQLFLVQMNTPGGLVDATLEINELFLNAPFPVAVLVAPSGAIAGSAGAFIILSSDIAAMAPGTTVGAAQPIAFSPEGTEATDEKTTIFYATHLRSLAREKGRPEDIAERFVTENLTLDAYEAYDLGVIEFMAGSVEELLSAIDGITIEKQNEVYNLNTEGAEIVQDEMNISERMQNWLSDPQIAFLVLMLGLMAMYFGFNAPGTFVPEVGGAILFILGIYGIGLFDTNTTGIILLLLGAGLLVAEIFTAGFGIFGIGGAIAMIAGALLLPMEPLMARDWYTAFMVTVVGVVAGLLIVILVIVQRVVQSRKKWTEGGSYFNPPEKGITVSDLNPQGMIKARGELWRAHSNDGVVIEKDTEVKVVRAESLTLYVRPMHEEDKEI